MIDIELDLLSPDNDIEVDVEDPRFEFDLGGTSSYIDIENKQDTEKEYNRKFFKEYSLYEGLYLKDLTHLKQDIFYNYLVFISELYLELTKGTLMIPYSETEACHVLAINLDSITVYVPNECMLKKVTFSIQETEYIYLDSLFDLEDINLDWSNILNKPFITVDQNTLIVENDELRVNTADEIEADNTRPVTSSSVHTLVGNIKVLLEDI